MQVAYTHHERRVLGRLHLNELEDFLHAPGNYTALRIANIILKAFHSVRLARSCLTVSKDGSVIALQYRDDRLLGCVLIYELLRAILVINVVERE